MYKFKRKYYIVSFYECLKMKMRTFLTPSVLRSYYNSTKKCYLGERFLANLTILGLSIELKERYEP